MRSEMIERKPVVISKMPAGRSIGMCASDTSELGYRAIGNFLHAGLSLGQKVALVGPSDIQMCMETFLLEGFDFSENLESGQLNYIFHEGELSDPSITGDFSFPLSEIRQLCDLDVTRLGILDVDSLLYNYELEKKPSNVGQFFNPPFPLPFAVFAQFTVKQTLHSKQLIKEIRKVSEALIHVSKETINE